MTTGAPRVALVPDCMRPARSRPCPACRRRRAPAERAAPPASACDALPAPVRRRRPAGAHPQPLQQSPRGCGRLVRVVVDDQDAQRRAGARRLWRQRLAGRDRPSRAVKWKVLPSPTSLSPRSARPSARPAATRWRGRGRCRRTCRVIEPSACAKASKIMPLLVLGDADPGVAHREVQHDLRVGRSAASLGASTRHDHLAWSVNLMALPTRLMSTWRSRSGSPTQHVGHVGGDRGSRAPAPSRGRAGRAPSIASATHVAQVELDAVELQLARPRSWRSRGCR